MANLFARQYKKILSSEIYLGHMVQGKTRNNLAQGRKLCPVPKSDWVIVRDTHTAIIDEETFQAVQDMTENCRAVYKERVGKFDALGTIPNIFKRLIFCADCKCPMIRYKNVSPKCGNRYYTYICRTRAENLNSCSKKNFHETKLKEILWELLQCEISLAGDLAELVRQYNHSAGAVSCADTLKREIASAQQVLDRAEMLHDSLFQSYHDKLMTEQEYTEMRTHYRAEMEQAKLRLTELERQRQDREQQTTRNPWLIAYGQFQMAEELTEDMVHALIERVEIDANDGVAVTLRYQDEYRALIRILEEADEAVLV